MSTKLTLAIAVAAGFAGGMLSHQIWPTPVHAQTSSGMMIRSAESLRMPVYLMNESGGVAASFTIDSDGQPNIKLFDTKPSGDADAHTHSVPRPIWSARSEPKQ